MSPHIQRAVTLAVYAARIGGEEGYRKELSRLILGLDLNLSQSVKLKAAADRELLKLAKAAP